MDTPDSIIKALGGNKVVAAALSLKPAAVSCWRFRGIPAKHRLALSRLAADRGCAEITLKSLSEMDSKEPEVDEARA